MIDTIVLKVPHPKFAVMLYDRFQPSARGFFLSPYTNFNGQPFIKCVNNPTKDDKLHGVYRPRLTIFKRVKKGGGFGINLHIECSLPKLLYGNNFDELTNVDLDEVVRVIGNHLVHMGVHVPKQNLMDAEVHTIHYAKNILFTDHYTASLVLGYLQKINMTKRMDLNATDFRNQGEAVRYYAKNHEVVFYDKIADLKKSKDRAIEKDDRNVNLQLNLFDELREAGKPIEVLRIEVRLKDRKKILAMLEKVSIPKNDMSLWSLFSKHVAQKILRHYWDGVYDALRPVLLEELEPHDLFSLIARQRPEWKPQRVLSLVALSAMIRKEGHRKIRSRFSKHFPYRTMQRIYRDLKELDIRINNRAAPFEHINKALAEFTPLRKKDFTLDDGM